MDGGQGVEIDLRRLQALVAEPAEALELALDRRDAAGALRVRARVVAERRFVAEVERRCDAGTVVRRAGRDDNARPR